MLSARGTKTVRLQRRKSGLDFSIKGGKEHGIGVVVSWIKEGGAAKELKLGDEILAVNGQSLYGLSHSQVVSKLRQAGATVNLLIRPNQTLEDVFSTSSSSSNRVVYQERVLSPITPVAEKDVAVSPFSDAATPLPQGWAQKLDQKTGRIYFENHYTSTTTWTDPRTRKPVPLTKFQWNSLPPGWERFLDTQGDIYYVNHHTQTTHWDSPTGSRQRQLLQQLKEFIKTQKDKLKTEEEELARKRKLLLEKNAQFDLLPLSCSQSHDLKEEGESQTDLLDDIMMLNEEVDSEDEHLSTKRTRLHFLVSILQCGMVEEMGGKDGHHEGAELAGSLASELSKIHTLMSKLLVLVESISKLQRSKDPNSTPLQHMLQLPALVEEKDLLERQQWVHVCPDRLTPKTNCELRLELGLVQETVSYGISLQQRLGELYTHARGHRGWEELMQQLATLDFQLLQVPHTETSASFRGKLEKWITF